MTDLENIVKLGEALLKRIEKNEADIVQIRGWINDLLAVNDKMMNRILQLEEHV